MFGMQVNTDESNTEVEVRSALIVHQKKGGVPCRFKIQEKWGAGKFFWFSCHENDKFFDEKGWGVNVLHLSGSATGVYRYSPQWVGVNWIKDELSEARPFLK